MTARPSELEPAPAGWGVRRAAEPDGGDVRIWGIDPEERLLRSLRRAGCRDLCVVEAQMLPPAHGPVLALRADVVLDERLVAALAGVPDTVLVDSDLGPVGVHVSAERAGAACAALASGDADAHPELCRVTPEELVPAYVAALRKREPPYIFPARADSA